MMPRTTALLAFILLPVLGTAGARAQDGGLPGLTGLYMPEPTSTPRESKRAAQHDEAL